MTPLDKTIRRSLTIDGLEYVLSFSPEMLKVTRKGRRLGLELKWQDLVSGESALAVALHASIGKFDGGASTDRGKAEGKKAKVSRDESRKATARRSAGRSAGKRRSGKRAL